MTKDELFKKQREESVDKALYDKAHAFHYDPETGAHVCAPPVKPEDAKPKEEK